MGHNLARQLRMLAFVLAAALVVTGCSGTAASVSVQEKPAVSVTLTEECAMPIHHINLYTWGLKRIMLHAREITLGAIVLRIIMAEVLGGVIGSERGRMNRPAGMRTYMLVSIGSCVVMLINQYAYQVYGVGDPVRLGAQVVSGIGFLGAGTIIVTTHNQIKGLTTAAGLWASACIGLAIGIGLYEVAIVACIAVFSVLTVLHQWDFYMRNRTNVIDLYIELDASISFGEFLRNTRELDLELSDIQKEDHSHYDAEVVPFTVTIRSKTSRTQDDILSIIRRMEGIKYFEVI